MTGATHHGRRRGARAGVSVTSDEAAGNSGISELNRARELRAASCVLLSNCQRASRSVVAPRVVE
jgi:hypothetical protein